MSIQATPTKHIQVWKDKWEGDLYRDNAHPQRVIADLLINSLRNDPMYKKKIDRASTILDLGCGDGAITETLQAIFNRCAVIGTDFSDSMIQTAKKGHPAILFTKDDGTVLSSVEDSSVDIIFSNCAFHWITNQELAVKTFKRVLTKNGTLGFIFGGLTQNDKLIATIEQAVKEYYNGKNIPPREKPWAMKTRQQIEDLFKSAFPNVSVKEVAIEYFFESREHFKKWLIRALPQVKELPLEEQSKVMENIAKIYEEKMQRKQTKGDDRFYVLIDSLFHLKATKTS